MKIKLFITLALAASVAVIAAVFPKANKDKESLTLQVLMAVLERLHFAPQKIDDSLSQEIYNKNVKLKDFPGKKQKLLKIQLCYQSSLFIKMT